MKKSYLMADLLGMMTHPEVDLLTELAKTADVIVNIGAGAGSSGLAFAEGNPKAIRYTVDICPDSPHGGLQGERQAFMNTEFELPIQILGDSYNIGLAWENGPIDLLFIDGDHSDAGIQRDIDAWISHLAPGGIVVYHDYGHPWWNIQPIIDREMQARGFEMVAIVDTAAVFKVNP